MTPLRANYSSERVHCGGDPSRKCYQCHLGWDSRRRLWVAWATYGPAHLPHQGRTPLGESPDVYVAAALAEKRLLAKCSKKRDPYASVHGNEIGLSWAVIERLLEIQMSA
jgi:hypothetical protein